MPGRRLTPGSLLAADSILLLLPRTASSWSPGQDGLTPVLGFYPRLHPRLPPAPHVLAVVPVCPRRSASSRVELELIPSSPGPSSPSHPLSTGPPHLALPRPRPCTHSLHPLPRAFAGSTMASPPSPSASATIVSVSPSVGRSMQLSPSSSSSAICQSFPRPPKMQRTTSSRPSTVNKNAIPLPTPPYTPADGIALADEHALELTDPPSRPSRLNVNNRAQMDELMEMNTTKRHCGKYFVFPDRGSQEWNRPRRRAHRLFGRCCPLLVTTEMAAEVIHLIIPGKTIGQDLDVLGRIQALEKQHRALVRSLEGWTSIAPHPVSHPASDPNSCLIDLGRLILTRFLLL